MWTAKAARLKKFSLWEKKGKEEQGENERKSSYNGETARRAWAEGWREPVEKWGPARV